MSYTCSLTFPKHKSQINCFFSRRSNGEHRLAPSWEADVLLPLQKHEEWTGGYKHLSPVGVMEPLSQGHLAPNIK